MSQERYIERHAREEILKRWPSAQVLKIGIPGRPGFPDRLVILPGGAHVWLEFKNQDGRVAKLQQAIHAQLRQLGVEVYVPTSAREALAYCAAAVRRSKARPAGGS